MKDHRSELARLIDRFSPRDGVHPSPVPGTYCAKFSETKPRAKRHWHAYLGIIIQGSKEIVLGREVYRLEELHYTAAPIDLPVINCINGASRERPFLALLIEFDPLILSEIASQLEKEIPKERADSSRGLFVGKASDKMMEAALRLVRLFETPEDAPVLGRLAVKEMFYHLLKGPDGSAIRQFARSGSKTHKISQAIYTLRADMSETVDVAALAKTASMSRSAFFDHFKEVTSMSPIQYQKRLRLLEARRLMTEEGESAEGSAFKVGYESSSQFSREYSRMFGSSPLRDAAKIRKTGRAVSRI
jgi:AraC-like DNA-binding protein